MGHETCANCGTEIMYSDQHRAWLHWNSGNASCDLSATPARAAR